MNKTIIKPILIIILSLFFLASYAQPKKVAVYVTGEQTGINKVLGDKLVEAFAKSGKYIAIERTASFLAELGKEHNYQVSGAVDDNELSRLGKQFGVQLVCVADVSEVVGAKYVSARLIDVETAEILNSANTSSHLSSMSDLWDASRNLTKELTAKTAKEKAEEEFAKQKANDELIEKLEKAKRNGYIQVGDMMCTFLSQYPEMTYKRAKKAAEEMTLGGYSDWRLPTTTEIALILNFFQNNVDSKRTGCFGGADNYYYCSSTGKVSKYYNEIQFPMQIIFVRDVKNVE